MAPELVLGPTPEQLAVHTPYLIRSGGEVYLFYCRCGLGPGGEAPKFRRFKIFVAKRRDDEASWDCDPDPVIELRSSVCRPWVVEHGNGNYRMYFVRSLPPFGSCSRIYMATSRNLTQWDVADKPLLELFGGRESQGSPCAVPDGDRLRLYFSAGNRTCQGDEIFLAEGADERNLVVNDHFTIENDRAYGGSRYAPFVFIWNGRWRMLFTGRAGDQDRYQTFLAESEDGVRFGPGRAVMDLSGDKRFEHGAYKAVLFECWLYFVGVDARGRGAIYRLSGAEAGLGG
jgi:hypothetical protein